MVTGVLLIPVVISSTLASFFFLFFVFAFACILTLIGFKTPWTIPIIIVLAGIVTNFSGKRIPNDGPPPKKVKWSGLFIFLSLFICAGFLSEQATRQNWEYRKAFNLFENKSLIRFILQMYLEWELDN